METPRAKCVVSFIRGCFSSGYLCVLWDGCLSHVTKDFKTVLLYQAGGLFGVLGYNIRSGEFVRVGVMLLGIQVRGGSRESPRTCSGFLSSCVCVGRSTVCKNQGLCQ